MQHNASESIRFHFARGSIAALIALVPMALEHPARAQGTDNPTRFAEIPPTLSSSEKHHRQEICLSGPWSFQPVPIPPTFKRNTGTPPELPDPAPDGWSTTPLKVPSPWNVNTWGNGRDVGPNTPHPYWPNSVYFPSYPQSWDTTEMGWVRRTVDIPATWTNQRLLLHFDAVAGDCQVRVNGKPAGTHFDAYSPFDLDVTGLLKVGSPNEILLGIRARSLFDEVSKTYPRMRTPYPCGSETSHLVGPWQDIYLRAFPVDYVEDVFFKPDLIAGTLELQIAVQSNLDRDSSTEINAAIFPHNADAKPPAVLGLPSKRINFAAHEKKLITLVTQVPPATLREWSPTTPVLYDAQVSLSGVDSVFDAKTATFGWRQFTFKGQDLLLNNQKLQLTGDLLHPFGAFVMSPAYARAWFQMIKDMGGNAVRLHAQPMPSFYLDLADEMGLVVLDETALFGSAVCLNFEPDIAWKHFEDHYDALVLRDRNHASVLGWSFGNELFAIFNLNNVNKPDADKWYAKLAALGLRAKTLDPTRPWISCDGDEDLRGALPVYSKHFGLGLPDPARLPAVGTSAGKPLMVGESGGTYYARPGQLAEFNGDRALESYAGRNEALAIDVYDNITKLARPRLAYYSASETAWFGLEHLPLGYHDTTRLPTRDDGVHFTAPYTDHQPGMQIERIPPYVTTLNPGWDQSLPAYKPLAMFDAEKAALAQPTPAPSPWDHRSHMGEGKDGLATGELASVHLTGSDHGVVARRLRELGVTFGPAGKTSLEIIDLSTASEADAKTVCAGTGTVLALASGVATPSMNALPAHLELTDRPATALVRETPSPLTGGLPLSSLYFAEERDRLISRQGIAGPILAGADVLLRASNTDWSLFNEVPEKAKCAAILLYEQLQKPSGTVLIERPLPSGGRLLLTTLDPTNHARPATTLWRTLLARLGLKLGDELPESTPALDGTTLSAALVHTGATTATPHAGKDGWTLARAPDRYILPGGQPSELAFQLNAPRATDDVLTAGPDAPRFDLVCYASETCTLRVNGVEIPPARTESADYRTLYFYNNVPLKKGWNAFQFTIASTRSNNPAGPPTAAIRVSSNNRDFFQSLDSAVERPD